MARDVKSAFCRIRPKLAHLFSLVAEARATARLKTMTGCADVVFGEPSQQIMICIDSIRSPIETMLFEDGSDWFFWIMDALEQAIRARKGTTALPSIVDELREYAHFHFPIEEALMSDTDYPDLRAHIREHGSLIKAVHSLGLYLSAGQSIDPQAIMELMKDWVVTHIALRDGAYKTYTCYICPGWRELSEYDRRLS
jgi:hemerythrin-like metal-binding protein